MLSHRLSNLKLTGRVKPHFLTHSFAGKCLWTNIVNMHTCRVMGSHHQTLVSVLYNCHLKGKGEHNISVTLSAKTYIHSFQFRVSPEAANVKDRTEIEELLCLLTLGCNSQTGNTEILRWSPYMSHLLFLLSQQLQTACLNSMVRDDNNRTIIVFA